MGGWVGEGGGEGEGEGEGEEWGEGFGFGVPVWGFVGFRREGRGGKVDFGRLKGRRGGLGVGVVVVVGGGWSVGWEGVLSWLSGLLRARRASVGRGRML